MEKLRRKVADNKQRAAQLERTAAATAEIKHALTARSAIAAVQPVPRNRLEEKQQQRAIGSLVGPHQQEMERILSLAVVPDMTEAEVDAFTKLHVLAAAYADGFRLFRSQAEGLDAYIKTGGLLGPIAVGWGKTLLTLMIANYAFGNGARKIMLLLPPEVLPQFEQDLKWARTRVPFSVPVFILGGKTKARRRQLAMSNKRGLYVMPYSLLSTKDTEDNLRDIHASVFLCDEAHKISRESAARTKRMRRYFQAHPDCKVVALSGTITSKSLRDYWHLSKAACRANNPLPNIREMANEWGDKLDSVAATDGSPGPLRLLSQWAEKQRPNEQFDYTISGFRKAFRLRLTTSPSVVSSGEAEIPTSLIFRNREIKADDAHENMDHLKKHVETVLDEWKTPNGDEIEFAMHSWKWLFELSAGFYNELYWPTVETLAKRKGWSETGASIILDKSKDYFIVGQEYAKVLRAFLLIGRVGLDTPMAVGSFMHVHGDGCVPRIPRDVYNAWCDMKALDFDNRIDRDSRAVRVCPYKVQDAARWALELPKGKGGIIWYYHQEMGKWLYDELIDTPGLTVGDPTLYTMNGDAGKPVIHCPAGANKQILDHANTSKVVIASVSAHCTGKNLQHFEHQLAVQWPRPANMAEQMLGRTHRNGQKADEIVVWMQHALEWDHYNFAACLNDAIYIHQTTGNRQKLVYGTYGYAPRIFSPEKLKALGCDPKILNAEQRALMVEHFGDYET